MNKKSNIRRNKEQWRRIIAAQESSGQSVVAYYRGKDFSHRSLYLWRRKIRGKTITKRRTEKFLEVVSAGENQEQTGALRVCSPGGYRLEVPHGLDEVTLRTVLHRNMEPKMNQKKFNPSGNSPPLFKAGMRAHSSGFLAGQRFAPTALEAVSTTGVNPWESIHSLSY